MVVVEDGCVVVVVVDDGAGSGMTVVVWADGGFTVVWEQAETRPRAAIPRDVMRIFFMGLE